jgi:hypothetical protein
VVVPSAAASEGGDAGGLRCGSGCSVLARGAGLPGAGVVLCG